MADKNESSVLFSLKELMNLEEDRIAEEEADRTRQEREARERAEAAQRAQREAEERKLREAEEARRAEDLRRREEEARIEAARQAELAKAQHEMETRARMAALAQQQEHEHKMAALGQDDTKKKLKLYLAIGAAVLVIGGIGGGVAFMNAQERAEKEKAALLAQLEEAKTAADKQVEILKRQAEMAGTMSQAEKDALMAKLQAAEKAADDAAKNLNQGGSGKPRPGGGAKPDGARPSGPKCDPNDPMCGGL